MAYTAPGLSTYDGTYDAFNGTGWKSEGYNPSITKVSVQHKVNDLASYRQGSAAAVEFEIKRVLVDQIAKELLDKDLVDFNSSKSPVDYCTTFSARVSIILPQITNIHMDKYVYKVDNMDFTHEQIEAAVKNTFPEHWL